MPTATSKTVHFVRHFQSTWNEAEEEQNLTRFDKGLQSDALLDAPLSTYGKKQALTIQQKIQDLNAEVAITSPLSRAIETCLLTYGNQNVVASHLCREIGESLCDIGTLKEDLVKKYPTVDFSSVPSKVWWYVDEKLKGQLTDPRKCYEFVLSNGTCKLGETFKGSHFQERIERFHDFLQNRPESNIVVFAHSGFLRSFLEKYYGRPFEQYYPNGQISTYHL